MSFPSKNHTHKYLVKGINLLLTVKYFLKKYKQCTILERAHDIISTKTSQ